jgi:hypothetical protein
MKSGRLAARVELVLVEEEGAYENKERVREGKEHVGRVERSGHVRGPTASAKRRPAEKLPYKTEFSRFLFSQSYAIGRCNNIRFYAQLRTVMLPSRFSSYPSRTAIYSKRDMLQHPVAMQPLVSPTPTSFLIS